ncbi:Na+/H+ antiporter subunit E [Nannocystaceae bacterium ST9]
MNSIVLFVSLMAFYVVLSGQVTSGFLMAAGAVCCAGITLFCRRLGIVDDEGVPHRFWWRTIVYLPYLIKEIVKSNVDALKIVWRPGPLKISPQMVKVPHTCQTSYGLITYCNSITLTPGTVTVEVGERELLVHCLNQDFADGVADIGPGSMQDRCKRIEGSSR